MTLFGSGALMIGAGAVLVLGTGSATAVTAASYVSPHSVASTPTLAPTGVAEQVRQLVECGGIMYAVGSFTEISGYDGTETTTVARNNIFSFSATAPFTLTSWNPDVHGTVDTIAFNDGNCADAYIGGQFTSVGRAAATNIAEIDTATGALVPR